MIIEPLATHHDRKHFDCGEPFLNDYIRRYAKTNVRKNIAQVYVAIEDGSQRILGYYSISACAANLTTWPAPSGMPQSIPGAHIGRLAVDNSVQGRGMGSLLVVHALRNALRASELIGIHMVELFALTPDLKSFYERFGFTSFLDEPQQDTEEEQGLSEQHLFVTVEDIRLMGIKPE